MVLFDLPETDVAARARLRRVLRNSGFGFLQNSVWVSPDPLSQIIQELSDHAGDVESIITFEARPGAGESEADIVKGAWDFDRINRGYQKCLEVLSDPPRTRPKDGPSMTRLQLWAKVERCAWLEAVACDPLLPDCLLPQGYLGQQVWQIRVRTLAAVARLVE
jgi:phenylacetic acid degradation operon negative regulatory protein